jgi:alpha-beta hydrolase superfamily lysophospholipase
LYEQWWRPAREPKAGIVLLHGLAEHSGRHHSLAHYLTRNGYAVDAFDLRGHGKSNGMPIYLRSFDEYLDDLDLFLDRVKARLPGKPLFVMGFSMGGTIAVLYVLTRNPQLRGVVLSGPVVRISDSVSPVLQKFSAWIAALFPRLRTVKINHRHLSRDLEVTEAYDCDPLVFRKGILARTGAELIKATQRIQAQVERFDLPVLILQGSEDRLSDPGATQWFSQAVASADRTLNLYPGLYHEVMNEPEKDRIREDVIGWLDAHVRVDDR